MEWYIMNTSGVRSLSSNLVDQVSHDEYVLDDACAETIEEILETIHNDDNRKCVTKRHLLAERLISKDLIPIIKHCQPDVNELQLVLRLLSKLCDPISETKLSPPLDTHVKHDLVKLMKQVRVAFLDIGFVESLFSKIHELIQEAGEEEMSSEGYDCIKYMLKLVRNICHFSQSEEQMNQLALRGLLLKNELGSILIYSIRCHNRDDLVVIVAQLLSLLYKDFQWEYQTANSGSGTQEDNAVQFINHKLQHFIVKLVQGPLSTLALALKRHELRGTPTTECNYLSWCLAYFLPFVNHIPVPLSNLRGILSNKCIGFLVYKVSTIALTLFTDEQDTDYKDRMMLMFSAIEHILSITSNYALSSVDSKDLKSLMQFYKDLVNMTDLWNILLYYIRNFDPTRLPRSFLAQLVCINHKLLTCVEFYNKTCGSQLEDTVLQHVKNFANVQVVQQYTLLAETYLTNSEQTNMAVFTMLCHICIDCDKMNLLYTPNLLRILGDIANNKIASTDDRQLAYFVTKSFLEDLSARPQVCVESFISTLHESADSGISIKSCEEMEESNEELTSGWTESEESDLFSAYADLPDNCSNPIADVTSRLAKQGVNRTVDEVANKLMELGIARSSSPQPTQQADITQLGTEICEEGNEDFISWLQKVFLTASYIKAMPKDNSSKGSPLAFYSFRRSHAYPMIPYTDRQSKQMSSEPKVKQLLSLLQIQCVPNNGSFVALIPDSIEAEEFYSVAEKLRTIEAGAVGTELSTSSASSVASSNCSDEELDDRYRAKSEFTSMPGNTDNSNAGGNPATNLWLSYVRVA